MFCARFTLAVNLVQSVGVASKSMPISAQLSSRTSGATNHAGATWNKFAEVRFTCPSTNTPSLRSLVRITEYLLPELIFHHHAPYRAEDDTFIDCGVQIRGMTPERDICHARFICEPSSLTSSCFPAPALYPATKFGTISLRPQTLTRWKV